MTMKVYDVPITNQILKRAGLSHFKKAVELSDLIENLASKDTPATTYTKPKKLEKLGLPRAYCCAKEDITESLPLNSIRNNKLILVPRSDARRLLKDRADEVLPITDDDGVDDVDGVVFPNLTGSLGEPSASFNGTSIPALKKITVTSSQEFVDTDGSKVPIALYGNPTHEGMRFDVNDIYSACKYSSRNNTREMSGVQICDAMVEGVAVRVVDMLNMLRLISHFDRVGSSFAKNVMVWCSNIVFAIQYGDANDSRPVPMAEYFRTVAGRKCPNPMAECTSKMVYLEIMGTVENLQDEWEELKAFVPAGKCARDYLIVKPGEGSGHRFGENARAIKAVYSKVEPECFDYRATTLDKRSRTSIEKGVAGVFSFASLPVNPSRRFKGDTEIYVMHKSEVARMWKYMQHEATNLEEELAKSSEQLEMLKLEHKLELEAVRSEAGEARALVNRMSIAIQALPSASKKRFDKVMSSCNAYF